MTKTKILQIKINLIFFQNKRVSNAKNDKKPTIYAKIIKIKPKNSIENLLNISKKIGIFKKKISLYKKLKLSNK